MVCVRYASSSSIKILMPAWLLPARGFQEPRAAAACRTRRRALDNDALCIGSNEVHMCM